MKIEICEQMVQSWLQHIKQCQIVQTNWMISPLRDISRQLPYVEWFMEDIAEKLNDAIDAETKAAFALSAAKEIADSYADAVSDQPEHPSEALNAMTHHFVTLNQKETAALANIFGQSTPHQFVTQCEIDVVGIKLYNPTLQPDQNGIEKLYLIDSAFHKGTLGYGDAVARVLKKLIRACLVSYLVFGNQYPVEVAFATPDCTPGYEKKIVALVDLLRDLLKKYYSPQYDNIKLNLYFNENFANKIYGPLKDNTDLLNHDNDLFMRALNLAKAAENRLTTPTSAPSTTKKKVAKTPASSTTTARKTATDDFADFKTFVGKSSASGYCTSIRKIMRELGLNTLADLEASLPAAINHCTTKMGSATNKKESKLYSDYRAALRRYEKFLLSVKVCP